MSGSDDRSEGRVQAALDRLWARIEGPSRDELRSIARSAKSEPRAAMAYRRSGPRRRHAGWAAALAGIALLLGSGLGFGLGHSITPSGNAGPRVVGLGFLPAQGWRVVQSEAVASGGSGRAIAANVPLHASDELGDPPYATLESLPPHGVVIDLTVTPRGNFVDDIDFVARRLPLKLSAAERAAAPASLLAPQVASYRLRGAVGAYNLDLWIYYGTNPPSAQALAAAEEQLRRLLVGSDEVTIFVRPGIITWDQAALLFGAVTGGKANELVTIELKECGLKSFHAVTAVRTGERGTWQTEVRPGITTEIRAVWSGNASTPVTLQQRAGIVLRQKSRRLFRVSVGARAQLWRKRVLVQQRRAGSWRLLKPVVLTDQEGSGSFVWTSADFRASVPRGTSLRAVLPTAQARPCLLGGVSNVLRS